MFDLRVLTVHLVAFVLCHAVGLAQLLDPPLAPAQLQTEKPPEGVITGTDTYEFSYKATLPRITGKARLWVPMAKSDLFQKIKASVRSLPVVQMKEIRDVVYRNKVLFGVLDRSASGKKIEIQYTVTRREKPTYLIEGENATIYLAAQRLVPVNEKFREIALGVVTNAGSPAHGAVALYDHVLDTIKYDKSGEGWGRGDAVHACNAKTGNCTDFHAYLIALCRSIGLPARFEMGFKIPHDRDSGSIAGYHCWAEIYVGTRWIPVDVSEASQHPDLVPYYFGTHPANRLEIGIGRDLILDPAPASGPPNFLVYPLLEIDGKAVDVETEFSFTRIEP
jgi:transglutaminase-like putative cysteine protease